MNTERFFGKVEQVTENYLTHRQERRRLKREKAAAKNPVLDWVEAFLWAVCVVLVINQYFFQAYQIPSGSMIDTLLIKDRIFVNKLIYGPELLPGVGKLPSPFKPRRNEVIIFENPSYISRGPAFDIAQRFIYMLTLSLVDIDKDKSGSPRAHFLIKRCVGTAGDVYRNDDGSLLVKPAGAPDFVKEADFNKAHGYKHHLSRLMKAKDYPALKAAGRAQGWNDLGLTPPAYLSDEAAGNDDIEYPDYITFETERLSTLRGAMPDDERYSEQAARYRLGWYVPAGRVLPLGDNRDNSRDGRYFGPVSLKNVLGKGSFKYWPINRIGGIR
jgi:signal peptidase I